MTQSALDKQVRHYIYEYFLKTGQAPTPSHCAQAFTCPLAEIQAVYQHLADGHALVLQSIRINPSLWCVGWPNCLGSKRI